MHVATAIIAIIATYFYGDWRNWKKYHSTILFMALGNLLYNSLTANYFLWHHVSTVLPNHTSIEMVYTFIVFPATVLMFLNNYPRDFYGKLLRNIKWITIYGIWEFIFTISGRIEYQYGWSLPWSIAFLCCMFPLIALHQKRPLLTYLLSAIIAITILWIFDVPVHLPVEIRHLHGK